MPRTRRAPQFQELTDVEMRALLARNHVGRIAYSFHDEVDIEPIHYVFAENWIYGRTSHGSKLATLAHHRWVAFEVDEVESLFEWRSVVVRGAVYFLQPEGAPGDIETYERALDLMRGIIPEALTEADPVPHRTVLFRISLDSVTGRAASRR